MRLRVMIGLLLVLTAFTAIAAPKPPRFEPPPLLSSKPSAKQRPSAADRTSSVPRNPVDKKLDGTFVAGEQAVLPYRSITVIPEVGATGAILDLQRRVAERMHSLDYLPPSRLAYFDWLKWPNVILIGWHGSIVSMEAVEGGYRVQVRVGARHTGGMTAVKAHVLENYLFTDGTLSYIDSTPTPRPIVFTF